MAALTLGVEGVLQGRLVIVGFLLVAGIAGLTLPTPIIKVCVKIMMASNAVKLVVRVKLVIEHNQGPLMFSYCLVVKDIRIFLGMSQRDESGKEQHDQQKFYISHQNSFQFISFSKAFFRRINPPYPHRPSRQV
jgi:hypothetical protein